MLTSLCLRRVAVLILLGLGPSCATQTRKIARPAIPPDGRVLAESEYEYVTVTGSNIPVRVPKSPTARPLPSASPVMQVSPDEFRNLVQRGFGSGRR